MIRKARSGSLYAFPMKEFRMICTSVREEIFEYYNDGTASFVINEDGYLIWFDDVEDYGNGMEFEKIG